MLVLILYKREIEHRIVCDVAPWHVPLPRLPQRNTQSRIGQANGPFNPSRTIVDATCVLGCIDVAMRASPRIGHTQKRVRAARESTAGNAWELSFGD